MALRAKTIVSAGVAFAVAFGAAPASAHFERFFLSSRTASMGGAFIAIADDPSATITNPAGLTQITSVDLFSSFVRPYDLSELQEHFVAAAVPTPIGTVGLSWHRFGLRDVTAEDFFSIAFGRDLVRTSQEAFLSVGASIDVARVSFDDTFDAQSKVTGSLSVLLRPFPVIGVGYNVRHIGEPSFEWVAGSGSTELKTTHTFGFVYYLQQELAILYDRARGQDGEWRDRVGVELTVGRFLALRGGAARGNVTGGFGVRVSRLTLDLGMTSHDALGTSYVLSLGFSIPGTGEEDLLR